MSTLLHATHQGYTKIQKATRGIWQAVESSGVTYTHKNVNIQCQNTCGGPSACPPQPELHGWARFLIMHTSTLFSTSSPNAADECHLAVAACNMPATTNACATEWNTRTCRPWSRQYNAASNYAATHALASYARAIQAQLFGQMCQSDSTQASQTKATQKTLSTRQRHLPDVHYPPHAHSTGQMHTHAVVPTAVR